MIEPTIPATSSLIPIIIIALYLGLLLFLGWLGNRFNRTGEDDYYLAGRTQGWLITNLTIIATFLSSFALLGAPGMVYREGVVFALVSLNVPVAGFGIYVLGSKIHRIGKQHGFVTPADMICHHYGESVALRLLVVIVGVLFVVPYVMMQIQAGGELAAVLFPQSRSSFQWGSIVLAIVTALYIMVGGMRSVAWTDAIQCLLLLGGMSLAGVAMVLSMGGWQGFFTQLAELPDRSMTVPGTTGQWNLPFLFTVCLLMPLGGIIQPAQWMRFYAAKSTKVLRKSAVVFIVVLTGCFLFGIMPVGLGGQVLYPLQETASGIAPAPEVGSFDQILVVIARDKLPLLLGASMGELLVTLLIVAIMAASMSTADSNLHALAALVTRDIYVSQLRPSSTDTERVWIGRLTILLTTVVSLACVLLGRQPDSSLAGFMQMIVGLALFAVAFTAQLLPITIDMLYFGRGTKAGATVGLTFGLCTAFAFTTLFGPTLTLLGIDGTALGRMALQSVSLAKTYLPIHAAAWGLLPNLLCFWLLAQKRSAV